MKLESKTPLIILVILTFLVVACSGGSQIAGTPTPEAEVVANNALICWFKPKHAGREFELADP